MTLYSDRIPQPFPQFRLPVRSLTGLTEDVSEVGDVEVVRTVLGRTLVLPKSFAKKYQFRLSASGDHLISPPADRLALGAQVTYDRAEWSSRYLAPGTRRVDVDRDLVPGTLRIEVVSDDPNELAFASAAGRRIDVIGGASPMLVRYRTRHYCLVVSPVQTTTDVTGTGGSWSVSLEEEYAT